MKLAQIPNANVRLKAPRNESAEAFEHCDEVVVLMTTANDGSVRLQTAWLPSLEELALLKKGCPVVVSIYARQMPGLQVGVAEKPLK